MMGAILGFNHDIRIGEKDSNIFKLVLQFRVSVFVPFPIAASQSRGITKRRFHLNQNGLQVQAGAPSL